MQSMPSIQSVPSDSEVCQKNRLAFLVLFRTIASKCDEISTDLAPFLDDVAGKP